jgi:hydroxymethylglutaryl-CoA lyase
MVGRFRNAGIKRQYLAGSIGMEDPAHVNRLFRTLYDRIPTSSSASTSTTSPAWPPRISWRDGRRRSLARGRDLRRRRRHGHPTTVGKVGNFPMEDLVTMLEEMGVDTGLKAASDSRRARDRQAPGHRGGQPPRHRLHARGCDARGRGESEESQVTMA